MILDIIPLHDRWAEYRKPIDCSTFTQRSVDVNDLPGMSYEPIGMDERYYPLGRSFNTNGCFSCDLNRYKVIEQFGPSIFEYLCLSFGDINVNKLGKCQHEELIPIWCVEHNSHTGRVIKHYLPKGISEILYETWNPPATNFDDNTLRNAYLCELHHLSDMNYMPELSSIIEEVADKPIINDIINADDEQDVNTFFDIGKRILPIWWDPTSACLPWVRSAVLGVMSGDKLKNPSVLNTNFCNKILLHKTDIGSIIPLISMNYNLHIDEDDKPPFALDDSVVTVCNDCGNYEFYKVNKYIEQLPYTYFSMCSDNHGATVRCLDRYRASRPTNFVYKHSDESLEEGKGFEQLCFSHLDKMLRAIGYEFNQKSPIRSVECIRSSNDDVYITYTYMDGVTKKFYFDLVFVALGAHSITTDYECSWFLPDN